MKLLGYRGRSAQEMQERLKKRGFPVPVVSSTMKYLIGKGFIDDLVLAETLKTDALNSRMLSRNGARQYLLRRGIRRDIVDRVFHEDNHSDFDNASRLVHKRLRVLRGCSEMTAKRRLYNFLLRRGYSSDTIVKVFKDIAFEEEKS